MGIESASLVPSESAPEAGMSHPQGQAKAEWKCGTRAFLYRPPSRKYARLRNVVSFRAMWCWPHSVSNWPHSRCWPYGGSGRHIEQAGHPEAGATRLPAAGRFDNVHDVEQIVKSGLRMLCISIPTLYLSSQLSFNFSSRAGSIPSSLCS